MVFHVTARARWEAALRAGEYRAPSLDTEGFLHCSTEAQLAGTLARFFAGQRDLVLLAIDPARANAPLRWEGEPERFPHLYGPLPVDAVVEVRAIEAPPDA